MSFRPSAFTSIVAASLLCVTCNLMYAQQDITESQCDRAMELLAEYTANRSRLHTFAVAARVECTFVHKNSPDRDNSNVDWYLSFFDDENSRRRFDAVRRSNRIGAFTSTEALQSLFINKGKVLYKYGSSVEQEIDMNAIPVEERLSKVMMGAMTLIDPFNLPVSGGSDLSPRETFPALRRRFYETDFKAEALSHFEEHVQTIEMHFVLNSEYRFYQAMRFKDFDGVKLPVLTSHYRLESNGSKSEASSVMKSWGKLQSNCWVPMAVSVSGVAGNPSQPTVFQDYDATFYWLAGDGFPEQVFDPGANLDILELRDRILENADGVRRSK